MTEGQRSEKLEMITLHKILFSICAFSFIYKYYTITTPNIVQIKDPQFSVLGPYNRTQCAVDDKYDQLINLNKFSFKINPQPCGDYPAGLLLMIIISSNPNNVENRMIIRSTWGRNVDSTRVVFLMGESENLTLSNQIKNESMKFGDIVQGNFIDVYRNMTYKHVMGLKWIVHHCSKAKYILKTDDDVVVNSRHMRHFLTRELSPWGARDLITCQVLEHAKVQRSQKSKWMVTCDEYAAHYYPTYCAGWAILYSQDVVPRLLKAAQSTPYFWIDDVHITGVIAQKIGIPRTSLSSLILSQGKVNMLKVLGPEYVGPFVLGPPDLTSDRIMEIWKAIPE
ncbi:beta-1,3-galactosyltransferase 5-like [Trichoplusia ni]|uniref:Hexosyltransferase n=1 Tax=Trichoplusia ni TaxID=7111 RepID=A0A7E5VZP6_TRINI|nr:beta-1,3-galactosyltransferase 5-like [Trichoplusia ni]